MKENKLLKWYKDNFVLDIDTQNEIAQKNFNTFRKVNIVQLVVSTAFLISYTPFNKMEFEQYKYNLLISFSYVLLSLIMMIYCHFVKNCDKRKNWFLKNLPIYFYAFFVYFIHLMNFNVLNNYLDYILEFGITNICAALLYNYNPLFFFPIPALSFLVIQPQFFKLFPLTTVLNIYLLSFIIFIFSFHKRKLIKKNSLLISKQQQQIQIITFGNFTILSNNKVIKFQRRKSLELIAYLVYKNGTSVNSKELMNILWGDRATSEVYGSSLRNLIVDIKQTLKELNILDFFISEYNSFRINPSFVSCDYYNFLKGDKNTRKFFSGEFMNQYSWAEEATAFLEKQLVTAKNKK